MNQDGKSSIHVKQEPITTTEDDPPEEDSRDSRHSAASVPNPADPKDSGDDTTEPSDIRLLDRFCRLCLQKVPDLLPLLSSIDDITIPEVFRIVIGLELTLEDSFPLVVCRKCVKLLQDAFDIRKDFMESYRILKMFARSKTKSVVDSLSTFRKGDRAAGPVFAKRMVLKDNKTELGIETSLKKPAKKTVPCVVIPAQEVSKSSAVQVKQEPELIIEPEEPPQQVDSLIVEEDGKETSAEKKPPVDQIQIAEAASEKRRNNRYKLDIKRAKLDPNKCYICSEVFESVELLDLHLPAHVSMIPYDCEQCSQEGGSPTKKATSLILLHRHFRMHASAIKCPQCPYRMCTVEALYGHMQIYHGENAHTEYTCDVCGVKLVNKKTLERHMRFHKALDEGRYTCKYCGKKFATKPHVTRHERSHTNERPFQCKYCTKSYKTQSVLSRHERTHTGEKGFRCEICDKSYRLRSSLNTHMVIAHEEPPEVQKQQQQQQQDTPETVVKTYVCEVEDCNFTTNKKRQYFSHKANHELKFQCTQCSQRFPTGQRLELHQYVHTGVKAFNCELCGKGFRSKFSLDEHMAGHNGVRPYSCETCGMSFVRKRTLMQHRLKHSDKFTFECRHCGKKFKYRADQTKHERTHMEIATRLVSIENEECLDEDEDNPDEPAASDEK